MRYLLVVVSLLLCPPTPAVAQVSFSIGIDVPVFPHLVRVPSYPVYYAPGTDLNLFFYDGMYWVYQGDSWYASSWYNGPWAPMGPELVPLFILRVPVRYYRQPPAYFRGWRPDAPPRWGEHWGNDWERRHGGWDRWNRQAAPRPAPLPVYQRQYAGDRYPHPDRQRALHDQHYQYRPRDPTVRRAYQAQGRQDGPSPSQRASPPVSRSRPAVTAPPQQPPRAPERDRARQQPPRAAEQDRARQQPSRAPEQGRVRPGRGAAREREGKPGQRQGEERRSEHDR